MHRGRGEVGRYSPMLATSTRRTQEGPRRTADEALVSTRDLDERELTDALGRFRSASGEAGFDGTYEIRTPLGSGGMGTVYLARDARLERDVAVKMIRPDKLSEPESLERFTSEARAMARVRHPNVVTVHAFGSHHGQPYLVMEYVPGVNLAKWRQQQGMVSPAEAVEVLDALCRGVQAIHDVGAIHGDLKPANVLIGPEQRVAVTDFGLARPLAKEEPVGRAVAGTPAYLAPEIARCERVAPELATRIDIYALGVMAFELLTGRLPFNGPNFIALLDQHAFEPPPRPSEVRPTLAAFDAPLLRALAKAPGDRQATAEELRGELRQALEACTTPQPSPLRVLVVDDDAGALLAVRELLRMAFPDADVIAVADPAVAMSIARRERPDVVVTDLHMPRGGGKALTAALRRDPLTKDVPIVIVTAVGGAQDWRSLRELGADRFLVKPVEIDMLVAVIRTLTGRSHASRAARKRG